MHPAKKNNGAWVSVLDGEGRSILFGLENVPAFYDKIRINLKATISPEKIAAKSLVILVKTSMSKKELIKRTQQGIDLLALFKNVLNELFSLKKMIKVNSFEENQSRRKRQ